MNHSKLPECHSPASPYSDILSLSRPEPSYRHPRMPVSSRAKIFAPFAALCGYEDEIGAENQKLAWTEKRELSPEEEARISDLLVQIKKGMTVSVTRFQKSSPNSLRTPSGTRQTLTGTVLLSDPVFRRLKLSVEGADIVINFDDLESIQIHP